MVHDTLAARSFAASCISTNFSPGRGTRHVLRLDLQSCSLFGLFVSTWAWQFTTASSMSLQQLYLDRYLFWEG